MSTTLEFALPADQLRGMPQWDIDAWLRLAPDPDEFMKVIRVIAPWMADDLGSALSASRTLMGLGVMVQLSADYCVRTHRYMIRLRYGSEVELLNTVTRTYVNDRGTLTPGVNRTASPPAQEEEDPGPGPTEVRARRLRIPSSK